MVLLSRMNPPTDRSHRAVAPVPIGAAPDHASSTPDRQPADALADLLEQAASTAAEAGIDLDDFVRAAWSAYVDGQPGLRAQLEEAQVMAHIDQLRRRGLVGEA